MTETLVEAHPRSGHIAKVCRAAALVAGVFAIAGCGIGTNVGSESDDSIEEFSDPSSTLPDATTTQASSIEAPTTTPSEETAPSVVGPISLVLPSDTVDDPRERETLYPDFVVEAQRWLVPDEAALSVVVQTTEPIVPVEQLVANTEAAGVNWAIYDIGPSDGSVIAAVGSFGDQWVVVGAQAFGDFLGSGSEDREAPLRLVERILAQSSRALP